MSSLALNSDLCLQADRDRERGGQLPGVSPEQNHEINRDGTSCREGRRHESFQTYHEA